MDYNVNISERNFILISEFIYLFIYLLQSMD